ncbi:MAG: ExbD/TolR family protein [Phycisphaerales bacterium]
MRRRRTTRAHPFGEINVTPLIDVVMCLIIFYLMVGKLATDRKTPVTLPASSIGTDAERAMLIVNVARGEGAAGAGGWPTEGGVGAQVVVEGTPITSEDALRALVRERLNVDPSLAVQIRAEQDFPFGVVAPVMRACTRGGATTVRLAARRDGTGEGR